MHSYNLPPQFKPHQLIHILKFRAMYDDYSRVGKLIESFTQFRFPSTFCVHEEAHKFEFSNRERRENAPTKRSHFTSPLNVRLNQMSSVVFFGRKIQWMRKGKSTPRRKKKEIFLLRSFNFPPERVHIWRLCKANYNNENILV